MLSGRKKRKRVRNATFVPFSFYLYPALQENCDKWIVNLACGALRFIAHSQITGRDVGGASRPAICLRFTSNEFGLRPTRPNLRDHQVCNHSQPGGKDEISRGAFRVHDNYGRYEVPAPDPPIDLPSFRPPLQLPQRYGIAGKRDAVFVWGIPASP